MCVGMLNQNSAFVRQTNDAGEKKLFIWSFFNDTEDMD